MRLADDREAQFWIWLKDAASEDLYFSVHRQNECVATWRRLPFPLATLFGDVPASQKRSFEVRFASVANSLVVKTRDYPFLAVTPSGIAKAAPSSLGLQSLVERVYFHDIARNEWSDVGCWRFEGEFQMRPSSIVTIARNDEGKPVLQSWAIPPQDSRWKAAGIAVAGFIVTWLLSGWRRSKRIEAIAA